MIEANITFDEKQEIRKGPFSRVFLATDIQLQADIVVKEIKKSDFNNPNDYFTEARLLYSIQHPNIAEIQYACEKDEFIYLSMPHYPQGSLEKLYNQQHLTVREIIKYSLDFLKGLHFIHTKGLIHLDVKPGNILINKSNVAVLTDFGLSKYVNQYDVAAYDKVYGEHCYPEAFSTNLVSKQADIYQAGVTLYRMCNGDDFFRDQKPNLTKDNLLAEIYPDRNAFLPHIPKSLITVIKKSLKANPTERYSSVIELMNALSKIDKNLDWRYNFDKTNRTYVWSIGENSSTLYVYLVEDKGIWKTTGKKMSNTQRVTNVNKWNSSNSSLGEAFKTVAKFIADHN